MFVEIGDGSPGDLPQLLRTALAHLKVCRCSLFLRRTFFCPEACCTVSPRLPSLLQECLYYTEKRGMAAPQMVGMARAPQK